MSNDLVSIIIPTYNRESTLQRAIKSAINQTYSNIEIIVVDDGSTDNTSSIVSEFHNITYIQHKTRLGALKARMTGIKHANGKYVALLDSDDILLPNSIESRVNALINNRIELGLAYGDVYYTQNGQTAKVLKSKKLKGYAYKTILNDLFLGATCAILVTKACFDVTGYPDSSISGCEDILIALRISKHYPIIHCGGIIGVVCVSKDSISLNKMDMAKGLEKIVKNYKKDIITFNGRFRLTLWYIRIHITYLAAYISIQQINANKSLLLRLFTTLTRTGYLISVIFLFPFFYSMRLLVFINDSIINKAIRVQMKGL